MHARRVDTNGVSLYCESVGDPADPAVLLIMGAMASGVWWPEEFCERLADRGRFVIRYDHRDTGRSTSWAPGQADYSVEDLADDAVGVLDAYGVDRVHLFGMSLGGYLSQLIALKHPDRVATLALIASERLALADPELPDMDPSVVAYHADAADLDWSDRQAVIDYQVGAWRLLAGSARPSRRRRSARGPRPTSTARRACSRASTTRPSVTRLDGSVAWTRSAPTSSSTALMIRYCPCARPGARGRPAGHHAADARGRRARAALGRLAGDHRRCRAASGRARGVAAVSAARCARSPTSGRRASRSPDCDEAGARASRSARAQSRTGMPGPVSSHGAEPPAREAPVRRVTRTCSTPLRPSTPLGRQRPVGWRSSRASRRRSRAGSTRSRAGRAGPSRARRRRPSRSPRARSGAARRGSPRTRVSVPCGVCVAPDPFGARVDLKTINHVRAARGARDEPLGRRDVDHRSRPRVGREADERDAARRAPRRIGHLALSGPVWAIRVAASAPRRVCCSPRVAEVARVVVGQVQHRRSRRGGTDAARSAAGPGRRGSCRGTSTARRARACPRGCRSTCRTRAAAW